jgi:hypothetical protein
VFGKIASPTTSYIVEKRNEGQAAISYFFFQLYPTYVFVRGGEKQLHL